jgi:hypothetical protein
VIAASVEPPAEEGNYEKVRFGSAPHENRAQDYSDEIRAGGGRVVACRWGLRPRYQRNHHQIPGDLPSAYHCTGPRRHRRKCSTRQLTFLCCCPRARTTLGADNWGDTHQQLERASSSSAAGQKPSALAQGTSWAGLVSWVVAQDPTHRWRLCGRASSVVSYQEERSGLQSSKTRPRGP